MLMNIEAERVRHRYTKKELAKKLNVSTKTYYNWVSGKSEVPADKIRFLKKMWGVSADYLLETEIENG